MLASASASCFQGLDQAFPIGQPRRSRLSGGPPADLDVEQPEGLGLGGKRRAEQAGRDGLLDVRALELRVPIMDHVEPAAPQGPAIGRGEYAPGRGWSAPLSHGFGCPTRRHQRIHGAGVAREERLGDPGDHRVRLVERLARLEQLPHLREERHLSTAFLQLVGVVPELLGGLLKLFSEVRAGRDVHDGGDHERTTRSLHRSQADLDWEHGAIPAASGELQPAAHRARGRMEAIPGAVRGVPIGQACRHHALDWLSQEFLRRPAERLADPRAGIHDATASVDGNHGIRTRVEHELSAETEKWCEPGSWCPRGVHIGGLGIRQLPAPWQPRVRTPCSRRSASSKERTNALVSGQQLE
jgi:hypothetical protein